MWVMFAFGSAFFAGVTAILAKCGMKGINSNVATFLRTIVVLIFSWLMVFLTGALPGVWSITVKNLVFLILSGMATGASWLCYFRAIQIGNINKVTPVDKCSTVLAMAMGVLILGEKMSPVMLLCMALILVGTFLMIQWKPKEEQNVTTGGSWLLFATGSAVFAALTSILGKVGIEGVDSNLGTAIRTIVVLLMAWQVVLLTHKQQEIKNLTSYNWLFIVLSGCATGASWLCYYRALQQGPASVVVPIDKLSILVTVAFSWLIFKEKLNKKSGIGLGLVVGGTLLLLL